MGEKIKIINSIEGIFEVEINKATYAGGPRYIHLQNDKFRFCITEKEFLQIAITLRKAGEVFKYNKGLGE